MRSVILTAVLAAMTLAAAANADGPVPVGEVVADPDAFHFRYVSLEGTVREVTPLPPYTPTPDTTCYGAYTFMLEDGTGSLMVSVLGICGTPVMRMPEVVDGETILLKAQIFSPNRTASSSTGEAKRLRAVANTITHLSPPPAAAEPPVPEPAQESGKPPDGSRPAGDSSH